MKKIKCIKKCKNAIKDSLKKQVLLHCHLHLNGGMRVIVAYLKVICAEIINTLHFPQDLQLGEGSDLPLNLPIESDDFV